MSRIDCLGVSPGIDVNILDAEVRSLCKARADKAVKKLVAKLPNSAKYAATGIGDDVARAVTAVLAVEFDQLGEESRKRETEIEIDLRIARQRNQELEAQVALKDAATAELEEQNHTLQKEGSTKDATIAELKAEIVQNSREIDLKAQMVAILKDVIANNALVESGGSTAAQ